MDCIISNHCIVKSCGHSGFSGHQAVQSRCNRCNFGVVNISRLRGQEISNGPLCFLTHEFFLANARWCFLFPKARLECYKNDILLEVLQWTRGRFHNLLWSVLLCSRSDGCRAGTTSWLLLCLLPIQLINSNGDFVRFQIIWKKVNNDLRYRSAPEH